LVKYLCVRKGREIAGLLARRHPPGALPVESSCPCPASCHLCRNGRRSERPRDARHQHLGGPPAGRLSGWAPVSGSWCLVRRILPPSRSAAPAGPATERPWRVRHLAIATRWNADDPIAEGGAIRVRLERDLAQHWTNRGQDGGRSDAT